MISAAGAMNSSERRTLVPSLLCRIFTHTQDSRSHSSSAENMQFRAFSQVCGDLLYSSQKTKAALPLFRVCGGVGGYADR